MTVTPFVADQNSATTSRHLREALIIGIGNDGRSDDGLGWAFLDSIKHCDNFKGTLDYRFQLQIEDAETVRHANHVVFVDAYRHPLQNGYSWRRCEPEAEVQFSSHRLLPSTVLFLCQQLYGTTPSSHLLLISGKDWDLNIGLSKEANANLLSALEFFVSRIK